MPRIAIVYHSGYGHTKKLAEAVSAGVSGAGAPVDVIAINAEGNIGDADWDTLNAADAIIFGSPTYMGMVSWQFKKFADATSKQWGALAWKDKLAAGFTNSGSMNGDKLSTLHYQFTLAMQHGMIWAGTALMPANVKASQRNDVNYLGSFAGLMGQSPVDVSPEEGPLSGDLETGRLFGKRVVEIAARLAK
jgi:NAD(P)H dehydrogenase (quinone)